MGKRSKRSGLCIFCGAYGRLTEEHGTPRWLGRFLAEQFPGSGHLESVRIVIGPDGQPSQYARPVGGLSFHKAPVVCSRCNNEWMSGLEIAAAPLLKRLARGDPATLDGEDARLLATWVTKTALIYELVEQERDGATSSVADRRWFGRHRLPLPTSRIWLAHYEGSRGTTIVVRRTLFLYDLDAEVPRPEAHGVLFGLVFGRLAVRVGFVRSHPSFATAFAVEDGPLTPQLWPSSAPLTWPPGRALDDEGFDSFLSIVLPRNGPGSLERLGERPP